MNRPTAVTVFGVLNIVFAVFGVIGLIASVMLFLPQANSTNPVIQLIHDRPAYAAWMKWSAALGGVVSVALLAAGIGLLHLKPWARTASVLYGIYAIVMVIAGSVVNYFFLLRPMLEQAQQKHGPEAAAAIGGAVGGTVGGCFGLIYPVLLLIFMTRPNVVAAFAGGHQTESQPAANQPTDDRQ
jgi:hypothetical protein